MPRSLCTNDPADLTNRHDLRSFLEKAGVSEIELKDSKTKEFIQEFILKHRVVEIIKAASANPPTPTADITLLNFDSNK